MGVIVDPGSTQTIQVSAGETITVSTRESAIVGSVSGMGLTPNQVIANIYKSSKTFGPYPDGQYYVTAIGDKAVATNSGVISGAVYPAATNVPAIRRLQRVVTVSIVADSIDALGTLEGVRFVDPVAIPGIVNMGASFNCPTTGPCTWDLLIVDGRKMLAWASPGDTIGPRIDVTAGGTFTFTSGNGTVTTFAGVKPMGMPAANTIGTSAFTTVACTKNIGAWRHMLYDMLYGSFKFGPTRSISGQTLNDAIIPGGLLDQAIADAPDAIVLGLGINDILLTAATSTSLLALHLAAWQKITAAGIVCIVNMPAPLWGKDAAGVAYAGAPYAYNAAQEATRVDFIRRASDAAKNYPGVYLEDANFGMTDTNSTQGAAKNGYTRDSIHFSGSGAQERAMGMSQILTSLFPLAVASVNVCSSAYYSATSQPGGNLLPASQGAFLGTGGTAGAGVTAGTGIGTGITVARSSGTGISAVMNKVTATDGGPDWQEYVLSGSLATTEQIRTLFGASTIGNFNVDDTVVMEMECEVVGAGVYGVWGQYFVTGAPTAVVIYQQHHNVIGGIRYGRFMITSLPFKWQAGISATSSQFYIQTLPGATCTVRLRRGNFRKVI